MAKLIKTKLKQFINFLKNGPKLKEGAIEGIDYVILPTNKPI